MKGVDKNRFFVNNCLDKNDKHKISLKMTIVVFERDFVYK